MTETHIFGELDLDLDESIHKVYKKAFLIGEACGYMVESDKEKIIISGSDNCVVHIFYEKNQVTKVMRAQFSDSGQILTNWHEVKIGSYISIYEVS